MSLRVNSKSITTNYTVESIDVVLTIDAGSLVITLPFVDDVDIKDSKSFIIIANNAYTLNSTGINFAINGTTSFSPTSGQNLIVTYIQGLWYLNAYDIVTAGGGITELTGDVTAGPGSGSQAATIANNAVTTAKMVQLSAYKFWANDTNASANAAEHDFRDEGETAITATITFTGTTAPSGASTLSQWWLRVGNTVFYKFMLTYATASTATTIVTLSFPTEFPAAFVPTGLSAASNFLYFMDYSRAITTPSGSLTTNASGALKRNSGNTANDFVFSLASGNYRTFHMGGSYRCS